MNYEEFIALLKKAIGDRSQTKFAKDAGIAVETLNRMLNMKAGQPSRKTLTKIAMASNNTVSEAELLNVSGYSISKQHISEIQDKIQKFIIDIPFKKEDVYSSIQEFVQSKTTMFETQKQIPITFIVQKEKAVLPEDQDGEFAVLVSLSSEMPNQNTVLVADVVVFYLKTVTDKYMIRKIAYEPEITSRYGSQIGQKLLRLQNFDAEFPAQYVLRMKKRYAESSSEEKLLRAIFGEPQTDTERIMGIGFFVQHTLPEYVFKDFILKHQDSFCQTAHERQIFVRYTGNDEVSRNEAFQNYKSVTPSGAGSGWIAAVVNIIYRETKGLSVQGWEDLMYMDGKPFASCVVFPKMFPWESSEADRSFTTSKLISTLDKYAKELRTEVKGCDFTVNVPAISRL